MSECLLIKEEGNISKGQERGVLWLIIYQSKHWDWQFFRTALVGKATYIVTKLRIQKFFKSCQIISIWVCNSSLDKGCWDETVPKQNKSSITAACPVNHYFVGNQIINIHFSYCVSWQYVWPKWGAGVNSVTLPLHHMQHQTLDISQTPIIPYLDPTIWLISIPTLTLHP